MDTIPLYQVDAFTDQVFFGNPASICVLDRWLPERTMQRIALENNQAETAFLVPDGEDYQLRWFTPAAEVDLCGHATLASAYVVLLYLRPDLTRVTFHSPSGPLVGTWEADILMLDFPALAYTEAQAPEDLLEGLGAVPARVYRSTDYLVVFDDEDQVLQIDPRQQALSRLDLRGVIVTAPGRQVDFVSRFFAPKLSIPEDSITGSAHCVLTPYWAERLDRTTLQACQHSQRLGQPLQIRLLCSLQGNRVKFGGSAVLYMRGAISLPT